MARPTLKEHYKFKRLCRVLRLPVPYMVGHLECLWQVGYVSGDPFLGDEISVEAAAEWLGEPGVLCQALLECGFIDQDDDGNYHIHDLHDHAPDYVRKRFDREQQRKNKDLGQNGGHCTPKSAERRTTAHNVRPPTPAPAPTPAPTQENKNTLVADATLSAVADESSVVEFVLLSDDEKPGTPPYKQIVSQWNALAVELGFPVVREINDKRKRLMRTRWASAEWREDWSQALQKIRGSPWHRGKNDSGWVANFDWFLQPGSVSKMMARKDSGSNTDDDMPF